MFFVSDAKVIYKSVIFQENFVTLEIITIFAADIEYFSNYKAIIMGNKQIIESLDSVDISILRCLQQDARLTIKEISREVNLSSTPVYERIKRMEREGFIRRYVTILDAEKIHKGFIVFCSVKLSPLNKQVAKEFCDTIKEIAEVTECYNISGRFDYLLKVHAPDMKYYQSFVLNVLGQLPMLGSLESTFVMEEIKNDFGVAI